MADTFPRQYARTRRFTLGEPHAVKLFEDRALFLRSMSGTDPRTGLWAIDLGSGDERLVVDPAALDEGHLPAAERARRERVRETSIGVVAYAADDAGRVVAFAAGGELMVADVDSSEVRRLDVGKDVYDPRVDPTGRFVAYMSGDALHVVAVDGSDDRVLASDPAEAVSWGRAEFVAAEEMGRARGFWWAPDGTSLLAARVDETSVNIWWISDPAHPDRPPTPVRYPQAGSPNADVSLHVLDLSGGRVEVHWDRDTFPYLAHVAWTNDRGPLLQVFTRDQRRAVVLAVDPASGAAQVAADDHDDVWVEPFPGVPAWCAQDVVRIVDSDDARRLVVGKDAVTPPDMYVRGVAGCSADAVVFTASLDEPSEVHVFRWSSGGVEQLTTTPGVHGATTGGSTIHVSSATFAQAGTRHEIRVADRTLEIAACAETPMLTTSVALHRLGKHELCAGLVLPTGHVRGTKLPVLLYPYGGPHAQRVLAAERAWLESQWWADQGFAVVVIDGRGTPGRGPSFERSIYKNVADVVLDDQVDGLLAAAEVEPDLDLTRVGIRGWSFGGYLAALAVLRRPDVFHAAVAGAPSADWAHYDTHYTERYLGIPQDDPDVYRRTSLLDDAPTLSRPLLLIHGLADDNVVAAHTLLLSQRLTEAGRPHSVLPLTGVTHMTPQEAVAENLLLLQLDFLRRALTPAPV